MNGGDGGKGVGEEQGQGTEKFDGVDCTPFRFGFSQISLTQSCDRTGIDGTRNEADDEGGSKDGDRTGTKCTKKPEENKDNEDEIHAMENRKKMITKMEARRINPFRERVLAVVNKSPYIIREVDLSGQVTTEDEDIWKYLFKEDNWMIGLFGSKKSRKNKEDKEEEESDVLVFQTRYNVMLEKAKIKTLKPETWVINCVVDSWVEVLNYQEKFRVSTSPYRLFCSTRVITDWMLKDTQADHVTRMDKFVTNMREAVHKDQSLIDLKAIDIVFFPMIENQHYYLIVFELKYPSISVIDNLTRSNSLVRAQDNDEYFQKNTPYKVKELFVEYLEHVQHPKTDEIHAAVIQKQKITWATTTNAVGCGVSLMRHMETHIGTGEKFETGFSSNGKKKKTQLNQLRKKYAAKILLSEINLLKKKILFEIADK